MRQSEAAERTRAALIDQFCDLYAELPLERITVKEISARVGVSRVTFYNYFADPYELLDQLEDGFVETFIEAAHRSIDARFEAQSFFQGFAQTLEENERLAKTLFLGSHSAAFADKIRDAVIPLAEDLFDTSAADAKVRYALEYHVSGMVALLKRWLFVRDLTVDEMAALIRELLMRGVLAATRPAAP